MKLKRLGTTGTLVSELCLGTMTFGWQADEKESFSILDSFVNAGGNFIDTADVYSEGKSEEIIGKWLSGKDRENLVLATKARFRTRPGTNTAGLSRKHLIHAAQQSLARLKTDYIDLFQLHAWDPLTPLEETFSTLNSMVDDGIIRYIGISNFRAWQFEKALMLCRSRGWHEPVSLQPHYNIVVRATEFELLPMAKAEGIAVLPWSPLAGGFLTGKYRAGISSAAEGTRIGDSKHRETYLRLENERSRKILDALGRVSTSTGKTMSQVALNWLLCNPAVTSPIVGARKKEQLLENIGATGWSLSEDQVSMINEASVIDVTYPYDKASEDQQRRSRDLERPSE